MHHKMLISLVALAVSLSAAAQVPWAGWDTPAHSIDTDFRALKNNIAPGHVYRVDDYIQFVPLALPISLKACTYDSRSGWGRMLTSQVFSAMLVEGIGEGFKYTAGRRRPNGHDCRSLPSMHTAVAFMGATMLHKEYGWRSPWWSFGGYSVAAFTALSRNMNDNHWVTDTWAGAVLGIGATELGYFLGDLIFKDKNLNPAWEKPEWEYCSCDEKVYSVGPAYARRFILGRKNAKASSEAPFRGSDLNLDLEIPLVAGAGLAFRATAGSLTYRDESSINHYGGQVGMFWEREFNHFLEFESQGLIGYNGYHSVNGLQTAGLREGDLRGGIDLTVTVSLNLITGTNSKLKAIAEWDTMSYANGKYAPKSVPSFLHSILLGTAAVFFW